VIKRRYQSNPRPVQTAQSEKGAVYISSRRACACCSSHHPFVAPTRLEYVDSRVQQGQKAAGAGTGLAELCPMQSAVVDLTYSHGVATRR